MTQPRASALAPGHRLDRYELLCPVGEGGMASVWVARLVRKHGFEKLVAIKTILPKYAEDETFQKMFFDEARIASRIDHVNVGHIHDLGEEDNILYLVMEWIDGDALTRLRRAIIKAGSPFPADIALRIMADVLAGLHAAHELRDNNGSLMGVVHRDVSPQNILVTVEGVAKLIDFGVAKARDRLVEETNTGFVKGKVQYMAPEQALGRVVDRRADLWAVGAVLYHLVAGRPPFEADNQLAMLHVLTSGDPPTPLPQTIPTRVAELIHKALTHDLDKRFQSAIEMRTAIERTGLAATTDDVAECLRTYLGDQAEARRHALSVALHTAGARATLAAASSSSGVRAAPGQMQNASTGGSDSGTHEPLLPFVPALTPSAPDVRATMPIDESQRPAPRPGAGVGVRPPAPSLSSEPTLERRPAAESGPQLPASPRPPGVPSSSPMRASGGPPPVPTSRRPPLPASGGQTRAGVPGDPALMSSPPQAIAAARQSQPNLPVMGGPPPSSQRLPSDPMIHVPMPVVAGPPGSSPNLRASDSEILAPTIPLPSREELAQHEAVFERTELMVAPALNPPPTPAEKTNGGSLGLASISSSVAMPKPKRRRGLLVGVVAIVTLVFLGIGAGIGVNQYRAAHQPSEFPTFSNPAPSTPPTDPPTAVTAPTAPTSTSTTIEIPSTPPTTSSPTPTATASVSAHKPGTNPTAPPTTTTTTTTTPRVTTNPPPTKPPTPPAPPPSAKKKKIDDGF